LTKGEVFPLKAWSAKESSNLHSALRSFQHRLDETNATLMDMKRIPRAITEWFDRAMPAGKFLMIVSWVGAAVVMR